jgi:hypothetical protein
MFMYYIMRSGDMQDPDSHALLGHNPRLGLAHNPHLDLEYDHMSMQNSLDHSRRTWLVEIW